MQRPAQPPKPSPQPLLRDADTCSGRFSGPTVNAWPPQAAMEEEIMTNEQQREGKLEQARGTIKENVGRAIDNEQMEIEGKVDQGKGEMREGVGDVREEIDERR
jgi:uncharacterized protein YjbJ (UPF0337 family)